MIPPDVAIRLRMQTEASLTPVAPTTPVSTDFANLEPGQRFQAQIQQPLPENVYRALVNGKEITLSLPESVKAGDVLELVVVDKTSRMLVARRPQFAASQLQEEAGAVPQLSTTAQMIGKLLPPSGQPVAPIPLNQGTPLLATPLPAPGDMAAALLPRLAQAATQSGLFYEAHQAQWLAGKHSTEALMQEPQAKLAVRTAIATPAAADASPTETSAVIATTTLDAAAQSQDAARSVPAEIRPLVQQQLDAAATQRVLWQGEVWPGQTVEWEIARDAPERSSAMLAEPEQWNTSLALTTPRLGRVEALLTIAGNTVSIRLDADTPQSGSRLRQHLPALAAALHASGISVSGMQVRDGDA